VRSSWLRPLWPPRSPPKGEKSSPLSLGKVVLGLCTVLGLRCDKVGGGRNYATIRALDMAPAGSDCDSSSAAAAAARQTPHWISDKQASSCMVAQLPGGCHDATAFNWHRRRHHCRYCGWVVCAECMGMEWTTQRWLPVDRWLSSEEPHTLQRASPPGTTEPQAVCSSCYANHRSQLELGAELGTHPGEFQTEQEPAPEKEPTPQIPQPQLQPQGIHFVVPCTYVALASLPTDEQCRNKNSPLLSPGYQRAQAWHVARLVLATFARSHGAYDCNRLTLLLADGVLLTLDSSVILKRVKARKWAALTEHHILVAVRDAITYLGPDCLQNTTTSSTGAGYGSADFDRILLLRSGVSPATQVQQVRVVCLAGGDASGAREALPVLNFEGEGAVGGTSRVAIDRGDAEQLIVVLSATAPASVSFVSAMGSWCESHEESHGVKLIQSHARLGSHTAVKHQQTGEQEQAEVSAAGSADPARTIVAIQSHENQGRLRRAIHTLQLARLEEAQAELRALVASVAPPAPSTDAIARESLRFQTIQDLFGKALEQTDSLALPPLA
jgi:hypothetical protein